VVTFGFLGQIVPIKGVRDLIEAASRLSDRTDWQIAIAGRDPRPGESYDAECHAWVAAKGLADRIRFLGFLDSVQTLYRAIDVAVVPSLEEPLGRVPLEASAEGRPTIAYATGGLPEIVQDGITGRLVSTGDVDALARVMEDVIEHPDWWRGAGEAARRWVHDAASPWNYVEQLLDIYRGLAPASTAPASAVAASETIESMLARKRLRSAGDTDAPA
jgi:glycosyltransferase involved in cell wall biosynthesis